MVAIAIDDPASSTSADMFTWLSLVVLGIYLLVEAAEFCTTADGGKFTMAIEFDHRTMGAEGEDRKSSSDDDE